MRPYYYLGGTRALTQLSTGEPFFVHTGDRGIATWIILGGVWETFVDQTLMALLRPGDTFVDIGANMGYYTVKAGTRVGAAGRVFSFEPNPELFPFLADNIDVNGMLGRAQAFNLAAGAQTGHSVLNFAYTNMGGGHVALPGTAPTGAPVGVRVGVERVDALLPSGTVADVIKLDAEGFEPLVFQGMTELLARSPEASIVTELSLLQWERHGDPFHQVAEYAGGRRIFAIGLDGGLRETTPDRLRETAPRDFVSYLLMLGPRPEHAAAVAQFIA